MVDAVRSDLGQMASLTAKPQLQHAEEPEMELLSLKGIRPEILNDQDVAQEVKRCLYFDISDEIEELEEEAQFSDNMTKESQNQYPELPGEILSKKKCKKEGCVGEVKQKREEEEKMIDEARKGIKERRKAVEVYCRCLRKHKLIENSTDEDLAKVWEALSKRVLFLHGRFGPGFVPM